MVVWRQRRNIVIIVVAVLALLLTIRMCIQNHVTFVLLGVNRLPNNPTTPTESVLIQQTRRPTSSESPTVHLVHVLKGEATFKRSLTLLKSVFYYQGRLRSNRSECSLRRTPSPKPCSQQRTPERTPIHLHLIAELKLWSTINDFVSQWRVQQFQWTLYDLDDYLPRVSWIPDSHYAGVVTVAKMIVPDILPINLTKAIVLDTDILLNANILYLWDLFANFTQKQIFGAAWEPYSDHPRCGEPPIPTGGVNSGVVLMHLSRMREAGWSDMFIEETKKILLVYKDLSGGEQSVLNKLIRKRPELYYRVPCEWHVQLWYEEVHRCCPVIWTDRLPEETICPERDSSEPGNINHPGTPNLVHFCAGAKKPEGGISPPKFIRTIPVPSKTQTRDELRAKFLEVYWSFNAVAQTCYD
ncbi:hypothetical protein CRM22_005112 [Opisthorchis felineus]|uniref:Glycosyltransferase-like protein LARGE n=1 Tax=Opisthorchis felineus TaxID=147828 RepID=A0A4S2LU15_OPIFE|nr:hypothetical protein CRM22_005112 [Opisthorchis felineus]